jgi:MFS transporter, DHA1 family, tetracycline resistance protein
MKKSPLLTIFFVIFFDLVGFGIVIPILPYYSKEFGASAWALGWLMASFSIMQFLFAPVWGGLSDRYGRRPILLATIFGGIISMLILGSASSLLFLFVGRTVAGIFGANISTASAYIADVTSEQDRAKGMGVIGAGFGLGFIFGPAIGGLLAPYGYSVPIFAAAALSALNLIFAYCVLDEPPNSIEARSQNRRRLSFAAAKDALSRADTALPILTFFLVTLAFTQLEVSFGLFVLERFQFGARQAGLLLALMGIVMVAVQGGGIGRLSKRFGERRLVLMGLVFMAFALSGASSAMSVGVFAFFLFWVALGNGFVNPSLSSMMSKAAPVDRRGSLMGIYQSAGSLARIAGPPISGYLFDNHGIASPIVVASTLMAITALGFHSRTRVLAQANS